MIKVTATRQRTSAWIGTYQSVQALIDAIASRSDNYILAYRDSVDDTDLADVEQKVAGTSVAAARRGRALSEGIAYGVGVKELAKRIDADMRLGLQSVRIWIRLAALPAGELAGITIAIPDYVDVARV